jgi:hypothetical protein
MSRTSSARSSRKIARLEPLLALCLNRLASGPLWALATLETTLVVFPNRLRSRPGANGAIAQLGERLNGIQEVGGSTPPGSTSLRRNR